MRKTTLSALIAAGLVAVAGVAQAGSFESPTQAGEASTMTHGVPNMATQNAVVDSRVVYPQPTVIENVPSQAGEASTIVNGRPNGNPNDPLIRR